jgi:hypothetical protein
MDPILEKTYQDAVINEYEKNTNTRHSALSIKQHAIEKEFLASIEELYAKMQEEADPVLLERIRCYILGLRNVCYHLAHKNG